MNKGKIITSGRPAEIIENHSSGERLLVHGNGRLAKYLEGNTELPVEFDGENLISLHIKRKEDVVAAVEAIQGSGLDWSDLRTKRDSLEDIFVKLVGEPMEVLEESA